MSYLLDTNIISEVQKGRRCNAHVAAWYASIPGGDLYLSALTVGEIRRGIERLRERSRAEALDRWLTNVVTDYSDRILAVDREVADAWGRLSPNRSIPIIDSLMVATTIVHKLTFVTRNTADASGMGALVLNPFQH